MPQIKPLPVKDLKLDLHNYRTVPQTGEEKSLHALVTIDPEYFWALTDSVLTDGWHGTENVIVLEKGGKHIVKEGNRRIGAIKLILGKIKPDNFEIPTSIAAKISAVTAEWKRANAEVPCNIFDATEEAQAERLVGLTHAKGEKAGRLDWNAVARARYNRDKNGGSEVALDLLEEYLRSGKNIDSIQKEQWGGVYHLTVLHEALPRIAARIGVADSRAAVAEYPKNAKYRGAFESFLHDIGTQDLGFPELRNPDDDCFVKHGFPPPPAPAAGGTGTSPGVANGAPAGGNHGSGPAAKPGPKKGGGGGPIAIPLNDPRSVILALKKFRPKGAGREKVVLLLNEARSLNLAKQPHAFCFLLRSMFEISAKCFCDDHKAAGGPAAVKANGEDRQLVDILRDVSAYIVSKDATQKKALHGATAEIAKPEGFLSVTSMNQLVHNKKFSVDETHISTLFHNVFPLLEAMNR